LKDFALNLSGFEESLMIRQPGRILNEICRRYEDELLLVVKSISLLENMKQSEIEKEIENLINLQHPCIAAPMGFVFREESEVVRELKIGRLFTEGDSLAAVIAMNPEWWTATAKAKAIVGIVLGLRFAHSFGLLHGCLNSNNILFDVDHCIQIADFGPIRLEVHESEIGGFSGPGWTPQTDVRGFASILFEVVVGHPANGEMSFPMNAPEFVSKIIEAGLRSESKLDEPFSNIFEILRRNHFQIVAGVDSAEVLAFVEWVESAEFPNK
jgi:serine/threonine protein kinase